MKKAKNTWKKLWKPGKIMEKSWNFVGQPQWEPCVCGTVCYRSVTKLSVWYSSLTQSPERCLKNKICWNSHLVIRLFTVTVGHSNQTPTDSQFQQNCVNFSTRNSIVLSWTDNTARLSKHARFRVFCFACMVLPHRVGPPYTKISRSGWNWDRLVNDVCRLFAFNFPICIEHRCIPREGK